MTKLIHNIYLSSFKRAQRSLPLLGVLLLLSSLQSTQGAEINISGHRIHIEGEIRKGDAQRFSKFAEFAIENREIPITIVHLNSPGGDLQEALKVGRIIRKLEFLTAVPLSASCMSSCVFILAAGVDKIREGRVGIHRPYFTELPKGDVDAHVKAMAAITEDYLREMNIPKSLAEAMFSIPPMEIKLLTNEEIAAYRLDGKDIAYKEREDLKMAERLGITRQEYMEKSEIADRLIISECIKSHKDDADQLSCAERIWKKLGLVPAN